MAPWYRQRWTVEAAFLRLTQELRGEVDTLGYPGAALFGFAGAVVAFNRLAVVKAALRAAHGAAVVDAQVSGYRLGGEFERVRAGLEMAIEPAAWQVFRTLSLAVMAVMAARDGRQGRPAPLPQGHARTQAAAPAPQRPPTTACRYRPPAGRSPEQDGTLKALAGQTYVARFGDLATLSVCLQ